MPNPLETQPSRAKRDLIDATMTAIGTHGLASLTSAKIAATAGQTAATVNFHFGGKDALLLATLEHVAQEFEAAIDRALAEAGDDPRAALDAIIDVSLDPELSECRRVAVWYAFLAESRARSDYQRICGSRDIAYHAAVLRNCERIISERATDPRPDADAVARAFEGLIDQLWQDILFAGDDFDRKAARRTCVTYLASVFPWLATPGTATPAPAMIAREAPAPAVQEGLTYTLPAWVYSSDEFFALEREHVLLPSWQVVCHISELAKPGDYVSFEFLGERAFIVRDEDGAIRAHHNVCAHRAHAVVEGRRGHCHRFLQCPYHGWTYHFDGRNRSVSAPDTFAKLDRSAFGLKPVDVEVFLGLVFVRFRPGLMSVAEQLAPYAAELACYRIEDMAPIDTTWEEDHEIDWKNVVENYVEDYHFPTGHPGLSALMEAHYDREVAATGAMRLSHRMREQPLRNWSARRYAKLLPEIPHLPLDIQRRWTYFGLFPNVYFDMFPEWMDFFHVVPLGPGRVRLRSWTYGFTDERRETRAARYLSSRLNQRVQDEDNRLTRSVQQGLASSAYTMGILSDKEIVVKGFQDWVRERLPVAKLATAPEPGRIASFNRELAVRAQTARRYHS